MRARARVCVGGMAASQALVRMLVLRVNRTLKR